MHSIYVPIALAVAAVFFLIWLQQKIMKIAIFVILAAAAAWVYALKTGKTGWLGLAQHGAAGYTAGLKSDVQRARTAQATANAAIKNETSGLQKSLKKAEGAAP